MFPSHDQEGRNYSILTNEVNKMAKIRKALERWKGPSIDFQAIANDDKHPEHHLYVSKTKQSLHKETDIKNIIRKARQGVVTHVNEYEAKYGDATALDFQTALNLVNETNECFPVTISGGWVHLLPYLSYRSSLPLRLLVVSLL